MSEEQLPVVKVAGREAAKLADTASVLQDLGFVVEVCSRLVTLMESGDDCDSLLIEALWSAALVAYVRAFATGVRHGLSEDDVSGLPGEPVAVHRWYKDLRDKHVVHSVNPYEEVSVGAILSVDEPKVVEGVAVLSRQLMVGDTQTVSQLRWLASTLRKSIAKRGKEQQDVVLEWLKSLPIESLENNEPLRSYVPGPAQVRDARSRGDA